jgi:hypothetical protein
MYWYSRSTGGEILLYDSKCFRRLSACIKIKHSPISVTQSIRSVPSDLHSSDSLVFIKIIRKGLVEWLKHRKPA